MSRRQTIIILALLALVASAISTFKLLPKKYALGERLAQSTAFWHDSEAFIFLDVNTSGRSSNAAQDWLTHSRYGYFTFFLGMGPSFFDFHTSAYRLATSGHLTPLALPSQTSFYENWTLHDGNLEISSMPNRLGVRNTARWDGTQFSSVPNLSASSGQAGDSTTLRSDDATDDDVDSGFLTDAARQSLKAAGWHWKQFGAYQGAGQRATLPIDLGKTTFNLDINSFPRPTDTLSYLDQMNLGVQSLEISSPDHSKATQVLWSQKGWQTVSKSEFETRAQQSPSTIRAPFSIWIWLAILALALFWKIGYWGHLFLSIFSAKRRMLRNIATSYSFPPAIPAQFPALDVAALDRYTRELESMGFSRLREISLVSNSAKPIPSFCRLFVNTQHHCFAEAGQFFPPGKTAHPLKCAIQSVLDDGWSLVFSDRKPIAASALMRRKKALGVNMPDATPYELLNSFLQMRSQVCQDLGISVVKDDTFEGYSANAQKRLADIREALNKKNFATVVPQFYFRKFALLKTRPEYIWLGDYPKEAESRKQGLQLQARPL
jgi:hypothetical protein